MTNLMKAAVLVEPGRFVIEDRPVPVPGRGEALIRISRVGVARSGLLIDARRPTICEQFVVRVHVRDFVHNSLRCPCARGLQATLCTKRTHRAATARLVLKSLTCKTEVVIYPTRLISTG